MLTSDMQHNLMHLAIAIAERRYGEKKVTGTAFMGVMPVDTDTDPIASVTQYIPDERSDFHVVFRLDMEARRAKVIDTHETIDNSGPWGTRFVCALCDKAGK